MKTDKPRNGFQERLTIVIGHEKPFAWAKRIGLPSATFSRIWNDGIPPKPDTLLLIAGKTGVSIDWLLTGEGEPYRPPAFGTCETRPPQPGRPPEEAGDRTHRLPNLARCLEIMEEIYRSGHQELVAKLAAELAACGRITAEWETANLTAAAVRELAARLERMEKRLADLEKKSRNRHQG